MSEGVNRARKGLLKKRNQEPCSIHLQVKPFSPAALTEAWAVCHITCSHSCATASLNTEIHTMPVATGMARMMVWLHT